MDFSLWEFVFFFRYMQLVVEFLSPESASICETFSKQISISGVNTMKMLLKISLECNITHYHVTEMKDIRKCPFYTIGK